MNINPNTVALARTARLVREAATPVYTSTRESELAKRVHMHAVEVEFETGGRFWSHMPATDVDDYIRGMGEGTGLSDIDHSAKCWCQK
jgi:hypothetical protein